MIKYSDLSRTISHALRHEPWIYELEMDEEGWVNIEILLSSLRSMRGDWQDLNKNDLLEMIKQSDKQRFNIKSDKIQALYGHSLPGKLVKLASIPPSSLFHGTSENFIEAIKKNGLLPMKRQYVHLSVDREMAKQVGLRKDKNPIILTILATKAYDFGVQFYKGNEYVWLADKVPFCFVEFS